MGQKWHAIWDTKKGMLLKLSISFRIFQCTICAKMFESELIQLARILNIDVYLTNCLSTIWPYKCAIGAKIFETKLIEMARN